MLHELGLARRESASAECIAEIRPHPRLDQLIATRYLQLILHFQPIPPAIQHPSIASRRSPVLTNGHGLAGNHDQPWSDALPIGDHLVAVLRTAWDIQNNRKRENMSPRYVVPLHLAHACSVSRRAILTELGKKYDQYLDFRQQDAHEFLCQLLDAVRMEEMDVSLAISTYPLSHSDIRLIGHQATFTSPEESKQAIQAVPIS